jgi:hypothetical protein
VSGGQRSSSSPSPCRSSCSSSSRRRVRLHLYERQPGNDLPELGHARPARQRVVPLTHTVTTTPRRSRSPTTPPAWSSRTWRGIRAPRGASGRMTVCRGVRPATAISRPRPCGPTAPAPRAVPPSMSASRAHRRRVATPTQTRYRCRGTSRCSPVRSRSISDTARSRASSGSLDSCDRYDRSGVRGQRAPRSCRRRRAVAQLG